MKILRRNTEQQGFVAILSAVIMSAILLSLALSASAASFYARMDAWGSENENEARALAEACVQIALLDIASSDDPSAYAISRKSVAVGNDAQGPLTCLIENVTPHNGTTTIKVRASYGGSFISLASMVSVRDMRTTFVSR